MLCPPFALVPLTYRRVRRTSSQRQPALFQMIGETASSPRPPRLAAPNIAGKAPFTPVLSNASLRTEKMLSVEELLVNGPSGDAVSAQEPIGETTLVGVRGVRTAGINLLPSTMAPAKSPMCIFTRIFSAMAAAFVARTVRAVPVVVAAMLVSAKSKSRRTRR